MKLTKLQCVGNDYLFLNLFYNNEQNPDITYSKICDRHFGVGADGLVCILYSDNADFRIDFYNSVDLQNRINPNMLICAAAYASAEGITDKLTISIETAEGVKYVSATDDGFTVNVGIPVATPQLIPVEYDGDDFIDKSVVINNEECIITCVSVGNNPCTVIYTKDGEELNNLSIKTKAPFIENFNIFPLGTNVIFANVIDKENIQLRCWQYGVGEVVGCGFGAAAAFYASVLNDCVSDNIKAELLGGDLSLQLSDDDFIYVTAKAEKVFDIEW